jgi:hypothetical protein
MIVALTKRLPVAGKRELKAWIGLEHMNVDHRATPELPRQRRKFPRHEVMCRARIRIGSRQYAGYLHNIGQGGARLRTITPIRRVGNVILRLPDLPPLRCQLRWTDSYNAGVAFELTLSRSELSAWARSRSATDPQHDMADCEISEVEVVA